MDIKLKELTFDELRPVVLAVVKACEGSLTLHGLPSPEIFIQSWSRFITKGIGQVHGLFKGHEPIGFISFLVSPCLMTGVVQGVEYLMVVAPEYRKGGAGGILVECFEKEAKEAGAEMLVIGCMEASNPEAMERWYRGLGYAPHAKSFSKMV